ncbi:MAG: threonylcarbamoyl-AMP synthase [Clostridiales bacterium]|jgi:L-threonylcarbamoyladenylate synthase|nr:threonylcarbamoyl-AMP synthase [Clostridiales bacterium]
MKTKLCPPDSANIDECAAAIKAGGLVAFPTETVYGLGTNALLEEKVGQIFAAKGRPADNPLIVHIGSVRQLKKAAVDIPDRAYRLLRSPLMPGPLTLVLKKAPAIPYIVTGGLDTVAVRIPKNAIAKRLLTKADVPVCAPSANKSAAPSPTTAAHVLADLDGSIEYILDGGPCEIGLESTVLDLTVDPPCILREGGTPRSAIESVIGRVGVSCDTAAAAAASAPKSPGAKYKHYAPRAAVYTAEPDERAEVGRFYDRETAAGKRCVILSMTETPEGPRAEWPVGKTAADYAKRLFAYFRRADEAGYDVIIAVKPPHNADDVSEAVINRLNKAAVGRV